ncbi:flagellar hook-length control protein FliK [Nitrosovibrio sp. Nv17]|uniref:flagellar hook-length control protein FliK n=1 Tax=Nitrosovibrio sp. Nv17 TaxID=1855339 RepID=UPI000908C887|nr:flagellar hook-length control protein FliK [Nitrosovibrio sp. Nv17]SFW14437.1 flagellar hook-length control protein FliK [Nitrosovibrio sp. Nv17]
MTASVTNASISLPIPANQNPAAGKGAESGLPIEEAPRFGEALAREMSEGANRTAAATEDGHELADDPATGGAMSAPDAPTATPEEAVPAAAELPAAGTMAGMELLASLQPMAPPSFPSPTQGGAFAGNSDEMPNAIADENAGAMHAPDPESDIGSRIGAEAARRRPAAAIMASGQGRQAGVAAQPDHSPAAPAAAPAGETPVQEMRIDQVGGKGRGEPAQEPELPLQATPAPTVQFHAAAEPREPAASFATAQSVSAAGSVHGPAAGTDTLAHDTLRLEPRPGASGWDDALGRKILWLVSEQRQIAELNLNPPELGPLRVVLSMSSDQLSVSFVSQQADVRSALETALPRLREMMAESGLDLGDASVGSHSPQQQEFERQGRGGTRHASGGGGYAIVPDGDVPGRRIPSGGRGLVDTFA